MLTVRVWASELRWQWFWVRWKEEMLNFHQDPTKLIFFDLCWRKLILKFDSFFFGRKFRKIEKSKNRKNKDFNWNFSKIENFENFSKSWFSKKRKFSIEILVFSIFRKFRLFFRSKNFLEQNFKINFLQHKSKNFNLVKNRWKVWFHCCRKYHPGVPYRRSAKILLQSEQLWHISMNFRRFFVI